MKAKAQGLRVLIRVMPEKTMQGNLDVSMGTSTKKMKYGEVLSVGPLVHDDGCPDVIPGAIIAFDNYSLEEIGEGDDGLMLGTVSSGNIFFTVEEGDVESFLEAAGQTAEPETTGPRLLTDGATRPAKRSDWQP